MGIEPPQVRDKTATTQRSRLQIEGADKFANKMNQLHHFLHEEMTFAQAIQEDYANRKRIPAPNYKVGDYVFVDAKNLRSERPSKKLDFKSYGPCRIDRIIGSYAYRLSLPPDSNAHPVFHVNKLRLGPDDPLPGQRLPPHLR